MKSASLCESITSHHGGRATVRGGRGRRFCSLTNWFKNALIKLFLLMSLLRSAPNELRGLVRLGLIWKKEIR
ncbi:hypothetical protein L596_002213 [Steinernema carpocapsae]|uniref:Uncharacterized protein n=1 Tax=Steinernema carpocapsae TaxID=34508 RepID=A0A4U8UNM2_STECR|nr:hypothetical protein L596_002213 [Steinernema carpocapsae]